MEEGVSEELCSDECLAQYCSFFCRRREGKVLEMKSELANKVCKIHTLAE